MTIQTCEECGHPEPEHTDLSGCLVESAGEWCPCSAYVEEPTPAQEAQAVVRDVAEGRRRRDHGATIAGSGEPALVSEVWKAKAREAVAQMAKEGWTFSADDLVDRVGLPPVPAMLGGVFLAASRRHLIQPVGWVTASRPSAHGRPQRTWTGAQDGLR